MELFADVRIGYKDYLKDESGMTGNADTISFPESINSLKDDLLHCKNLGIKATIQGSRTGLTGGASPSGGHIINVGKMNRFLGLSGNGVDDPFRLRVQPGVLLSEIKEALISRRFPGEISWDEGSKKSLELFKKGESWFFPPDPTEVSASIGGMVACNASGALTYAYGATRTYIDSLIVLLADGEILKLKRGRNITAGREFSCSSDDGKEYKGTLPGYCMPETKNAAGLYVKSDMDLIDLFIGSEGTLGVITEIECLLVPSPEAIWGMVSFFPYEDAALNFVQLIRGLPEARKQRVHAYLGAIEFFDYDSLQLIREEKSENQTFSEIPSLSERFHSAVYTEYHGPEAEIIQLMGKTAKIMGVANGNEADTWIADNTKELHRLKIFRHAVPEAVNLRVQKQRLLNASITKMGTDMAVPDKYLGRILKMYRDDIKNSGLKSAIFGHIGNNHLHVNILPRSMGEYNAGMQIFYSWSKIVVSLGGTVSAEHGIGKLKKSYLKKLYTEKEISEIKKVIHIFNPDRYINDGNMVE